MSYCLDEPEKQVHLQQPFVVAEFSAVEFNERRVIAVESKAFAEIFVDVFFVADVTAQYVEAVVEIQIGHAIADVLIFEFVVDIFWRKDLWLLRAYEIEEAVRLGGWKPYRDIGTDAEEGSEDAVEAVN